MILKGVVGLISDFGQGVYAGIMAEIVSCLGGVPIHIDHSIPSFNVTAGAYVSLQTYRWLPKGSSLAVVVDPGVGTKRKAIAVKTRNYYLVGPDNGVLYPASIEDGITKIYEIDPTKLLDILKNKGACVGFLKHKVSSTFHGRDLFAPAASLLSLGMPPESFTKGIVKTGEIVKLKIEDIDLHDNKFTFKVIYIDKFGNIALSWRKLPLSIGDRVLVCNEESKICVNGRISRTFQDVKIGEVLVYINSFGFLEIAVNQGSASKKLNAKIGNRMSIKTFIS